jgi:hypothetical protein
MSVTMRSQHFYLKNNEKKEQVVPILECSGNLSEGSEVTFRCAGDSSLTEDPSSRDWLIIKVDFEAMMWSSYYIRIQSFVSGEDHLVMTVVIDWIGHCLRLSLPDPDAPRREGGRNLPQWLDWNLYVTKAQALGIEV